MISNSVDSFLGAQNFLVCTTKTNFEEPDGLGINEKKFARHIVHLTNEVVSVLNVICLQVPEFSD